jgi:predicted  nucleic acid-binding Zn-ribbon protein
MVFGWGKKKQENIEQQTQKSQSEQKIGLSEIDSILLRQKELKQKKVVAQTAPLFSEIQKELNSIYGIVIHLQNDDLKIDDIEKILRVLVVRSKAEVIDVISKESKKQLPQIANYEDVVTTAELASHTLKKIGDVLGKNSRVIHVFAKKYANDLKAHLEVITKNHLMISKLIGDSSSLESSSSAIKEKTAKIASIHKEIDKNSLHLDKLRKLKNDSESLIASTQQKITNMRTSSQYAKLLECQEQIKQVMAQENKLNKEIDDEFSKISRPLGKYVYVTSLEKPLKVILEKLVASPSSTILENKNSIVAVLESCMKAIMSGTVSVKETDKSVDHITHILSLLDGFISDKNNVHSKLQDLQQNLGIFDLRQLEDLEKLLVKAKSDKDDSESKIKTLESELQQQTEQRQNLVLDLEGLLEKVSGTKYQVLL